jgi:hypothetical protein
MALLLKVIWVERSAGTDPFQRIKHIGGQNGQFQWKHTHADAIYSTEKEHFHYYIKKNGRVLKVMVGMAPNGIKYLKTELDDDQPESLLALPEFPEELSVGKEYQKFGGDRLYAGHRDVHK